MRIEGSDSLPDDLIDNALSAYEYSDRATPAEKMAIRQRAYADEHGPFHIETSCSEEVLQCTLHVDGDDHTSRIPLHLEPTVLEVYPWGDVRFENIQLLSVSFRSDYPWTPEAFVVTYWADAVGDVDSHILENTHILMQYYPPRGVTDDDDILPEVAGYGDEETLAARDIRNFTHAATPNPWVKYSLMLLYENAELAERVLTHEGVHMPEDQYHRTPPEELHQADSA